MEGLANKSGSLRLLITVSRASLNRQTEKKTRHCERYFVVGNTALHSMQYSKK